MRWQYIFLFVLFLESCSKPDTEYFYLTDFQKKLANFQKGSYWIYKNDSTSVVDSVYVEGFNRTMENHEGDGRVEWSSEEYHCGAQSTLDSNLSVIYLSDAHYNEGQCILSDISTNKSKWSIYYKTNNNTLSGNQTYYQFPTFSINGLSFNNVTEFIYSNAGGVHGIDSVLDGYIGQDVGLIKWNVQYKDSSRESWSLIRYNIVR